MRIWSLFLPLLLSWPLGPARAQTVVEMDLKSARQLLENHDLGQASQLLTNLANNYKQYTNIRVHSRRQAAALALLAKALRTDFDGSGSGYIADLNIWAIFGQPGNRTYLAASLMEPEAVLLSTDVDYLKGMLAYEILELLRSGTLGLDQARRKALRLGIEIQVEQTEAGDRTITFFGHGADEDQLVGKLVVIEPPDFIW